MGLLSSLHETHPHWNLPMDKLQIVAGILFIVIVICLFIVPLRRMDKKERLDDNEFFRKL